MPGSLLRRSSRLGTSPARSLARLVGRSLGLLHLAASGHQVAVGFHLLLERLGSHRLGMGFGLRGLLGRQGCHLSRSRSLGVGRRVARHRFGSHFVSRRRRHFRIKPHGLGAFHRGRLLQAHRGRRAIPAFSEIIAGWLKGMAPKAPMDVPLVFTGWFMAAGSSPASIAGEDG